MTSGGLLIAATAPALASGQPTPAISFRSDARVLIAGTEDSDDGSLRLRTGLSWAAWSGVTVVVRAAISASTTGNEWSVGSFPSAQTATGLAPGNATLDLAHLQFDPAPRLRLRIGRFQETLALPAVPDKSLDRKDSDGTGISYSDGVSAEYQLGRRWSLIGIAQYQPPDGATNRPREPLSFVDEGSRASGFFALRNVDDSGPWAFRSLSYSIFPDSLAEDGKRHAYSGLVGNLMARVPHGGPGELLIGGSAGYAPEIASDAKGSAEAHLAWQATVNWVDFGPRDQSVGVVYMRTGSGWLLSPDLADRLWLAEIRYRIVPVRNLTCELRLRYRGDTERPEAGGPRDVSHDWYLRLTWRR